MEKIVLEFNVDWNLDTFVEIKEPLMFSVTGEMTQQQIGTSFLGPVFEEKFHMRCLTGFILPCIRLIPEHMKSMAHPDISRNQFEDGIKVGYYWINLSLNQTFGRSEFRPMDDNDNNADSGDEEDTPMHMNENEIHSDNEEIRNQPDNNDAESIEDPDFDAQENLAVEESCSENEDLEHEEGYNYSDSENSAQNRESHTEEPSKSNIPQVHCEAGNRDSNELNSEQSSSEWVNFMRNYESYQRERRYIIANESDSESHSQASSSDSIVNAMNNARLSSEGRSRSTSIGSNTSNISLFAASLSPLRSNPYNSSQQNLDTQIANSRRGIKISSYFERAPPNNSNNDEHRSLSRSGTPDSQKRSFDETDEFLENIDEKRTRLSVPHSPVPQTAPALDAQTFDDGDTNNASALSNNAEGSTSNIKSRAGISRKGDNKDTTKKKNPMKKAGKTKKSGAYGSMEQFVFNANPKSKQ